MTNTTRKDKVDQFFEICRKNDLKITPQRTAIYKAVVSSENHPSTDDIFQIVRRDYPSISFDTVNRTLMTFTQIGLVSVAESFKGSRRFDPNMDDHHHMHCLQCGEIVDFTHDDFDKLVLPVELEEKFSRVLSSRVVLNGICLECSKK